MMKKTFELIMASYSSIYFYTDFNYVPHFCSFIGRSKQTKIHVQFNLNSKLVNIMTEAEYHVRMSIDQGRTQSVFNLEVWSLFNSLLVHEVLVPNPDVYLPICLLAVWIEATISNIRTKSWQPGWLLPPSPGLRWHRDLGENNGLPRVSSVCSNLSQNKLVAYRFLLSSATYPLTLPTPGPWRAQVQIAHRALQLQTRIAVSRV
jgi:hypothetical protein